MQAPYANWPAPDARQHMHRAGAAIVRVAIHDIGEVLLVGEDTTANRDDFL
jgi:hypothetical protein